MSKAAEKLKAAVLELSLADRLDVLDALAASIPGPPNGSDEGTPEFDAVLARRAAELDSGAVKGVPAEEVLERLRKKYAR